MRTRRSIPAIRHSFPSGALGALLIILALLPAAPAEAQPLVGFADMHTHPMSHLGFGGMILFGAPDESSLMLEGQRYRGWAFGAKNCWPNGAAGSIDVALGVDAPLHGGFGGGTTTFSDANNCGDHIRQAIVERVEEIYDHPPGSHWRPGYPDFADWPHWSSVTHQQMWWQWIKRSVDNGQRVMVALAVNNSLLAKAANASQFVDDKSSIEKQLAEIEAFAGRHADFMAVVKTPADLRRVVLSNRMAVILGVETDDLGNLARRASFGGERITQPMVDAEIRRLHSLGVRYILPIHFSNTPLGGYAINKSLFALSSKEYTNSFPSPTETCGEGIHFALQRVVFANSLERDALRTRDLGRIIDTQPEYTPPRPGCGHKNSLPLTALGEGAIQTMMSLGMMIDIDHMSRLAADRTLEIAQARNYPVSSGHNGLLADDCFSGGGDLQHCTENQRTKEQYQKIHRLGGLIGVGHGGRATNFVRHYRTVLELTGNGALAIGTDANGLEPLPAPDPLAPVRYDASFPMYRQPTPTASAPGGSKTWDFNRIGFAHYGLFPDYIRSWRSSTDPATRMTDRAMDAFMSSAEGFARMWEKSALRATGAPRTAPLTLTTGWCTHAGASVSTGDFDGDGANDLLCRDANRMYIDYADGRGALAGATDWSLDTQWFTHAGIRLLGLRDFNGDGRTDLLCKDATRIWINLADSQGHFSAAGSFVQDTVWCTHAGITFLGLGDFNGDGRADLLCKDPARIWINLADAQGHFSVAGSFVRDTTWCTHAGITFFGLGDFNGDGRTDLMCKDRTRIWINTADSLGNFSAAGSFVRDTVWCTHPGITFLGLGDFNGDGRADLLCKDPTRIWINTADSQGNFAAAGSFVQDTTWCARPGATSRLADVNGDGRADLLCRDGRTAEIAYADAGGRFSLP
jgi:hypothetical protein